jgi:hypothetical protein
MHARRWEFKSSILLMISLIIYLFIYFMKHDTTLPDCGSLPCAPDTRQRNWGTRRPLFRRPPTTTIPRHTFWRHRGFLLWARRRAHNNLCRVSSSTVGQKKLHRTAVDGVMEGLPCAWREALGKLCRVPPCGRRHCIRKTFFNCFKKMFLPRVVHGAHDKP